MKSRGFTLIEILIAIFIATILLTIALGSLKEAQTKKELETTTNSIAFSLEEAKSNALAGKEGASFGIKFNDDSYISFQGSSFISSNESNVRREVGDKFELTNTITNSDDAIIFARLTGNTNMSATVTVSLIGNPLLKKDIHIGPLGDISVVE